MRYLLALLCSFFLLVGCNGGSEDSSASPLPTEAEQTSTSISAQDIVSMQMQLEYDEDITNNEIRSGFQQQFCLIGADTDTPISEGVILTPGAPGQCSPSNDDEGNVVYAEIEWSSSNNQVANVDENGNFTAVSPGNVIITANLVGYDVSCALELVIADPEPVIPPGEEPPVVIIDPPVEPEPPFVINPKNGITILYKVAVEDDANPAVYGTATEYDNSTDDSSSKWIEAINIDNTPELYPLILTPDVGSEDVWASGVPKINTECEPYASINIVDNSALIYLQHNDIPQGVLNCTLDVLPSASSVESDSLLEEKFEFSIFSLHDESVIDAGLRPTVSDEKFKTEEGRFEYLSFDKPQTYFDISYLESNSDNATFPQFGVEQYSQIELYYRVPNILLRVNTSSIVQENDIISLSVEGVPWFEEELCLPKFNQSLTELPPEDCNIDTSTLSLNYFGSKVIQPTIWIVSEGESTDELQISDLSDFYSEEADIDVFPTFKTLPINESNTITIDAIDECTLDSGVYYCGILALLKINNPTSRAYKFHTNEDYQLDCHDILIPQVQVSGCFNGTSRSIDFLVNSLGWVVYSAEIERYDNVEEREIPFEERGYYFTTMRLFNLEQEIETNYNITIKVKYIPEY